MCALLGIVAGYGSPRHATIMSCHQIYKLEHHSFRASCAEDECLAGIEDS